MSGHGGGKRKKKVHHEEHVNHERWLVTYADMVTLLMVLFIVLFAISQVDQKKYMQLAAGLSNAFGGPVRVIASSDGLLPQSTDGSLVPFDPRTTINIAPEPGVDLKKDASKSDSTAGTATAEVDSRIAKALAENAKLDEVQKKIAAELKKTGYDKSVKFTRDERGLTITVVTDKIVFPADAAALQPAGEKIIDAVGQAIRSVPNQIAVEGHTNQAAARPVNFIDEWALSSARAAAVLRILQRDGVVPSRLRAVGFGDTRPLIDPKDPRALDVNRRVDVIVLSDFAPATDAAPKSIASSPSDRPFLDKAPKGPSFGTSDAPTTPTTTPERQLPGLPAGSGLPR